MSETRFESINSFVAVAQKLSFVEAAEVISIDPSTLSRRIRHLERSLGVQLFNRSTRHVTLTEAGIIYLKHSLDILEKLDEADAKISNMCRNPHGLLNITLPVAFGQKYINPLLPKFLSLYPHIKLNVIYSDQFVNLFEEKIDIAIRIGHMKDSQLSVRKIISNHRVLCASSDYLSHHGRPEKPEDLKKHNCLVFSSLATGNKWHLLRGEKHVVVPVEGNIKSDQADLLYRAALNNCGIALLSTFIVGADLESGRLETVLDEWNIPETNVFAVFRKGQHLPSKIEVFVNFLLEQFCKLSY